jgi:hypothetical protein
VTPPLLTNLLQPEFFVCGGEEMPELWPPKCAPPSVLRPIAGNTRN